MERLRVGALQYLIRPIKTFDEFRDQVSALVETAADYQCGLVVFPEYFTVQLLTLGDVKRPIRDQVRSLAALAPRVIELLARLAREQQIYIVGGTVPVMCRGDLEVADRRLREFLEKWLVPGDYERERSAVKAVISPDLL